MRSTRAWRLAPWVVRIVIPDGVVGVYLLGDVRPAGMPLDITYVGRSDKNLRRRLLHHCSAGRADMFKFAVCSDSDHAFRVECFLWHATKGKGLITNINHPAAPAAARTRCPFCLDDDTALGQNHPQPTYTLKKRTHAESSPLCPKT